jgi:predicted transcriptional regulator
MSSAQRRTGEIETRILELCLDGIGKTAIVYNSNLNFATANRYLKSLQDKGLIEVIQGERPIYKTTPKGKSVLEHIWKIKEIINNSNCH